MKHWNRNALACAMMSAMALLAGCGGDNDNDNSSDPETPPVTEPPVQARPLELTILHINDHHSTLDGKDRTLTLKNAADTVTAVSAPAAFFRVSIRAFPASGE